VFSSYTGLVLANIFGPDVLIVLLLAVVLLFGATQLPKMARSFGEARKELKKGQGGENGPDVAPAGKARKPAKSANGSKSTPNNDQVTMTKEELQALIDERVARGQRSSAADADPAV
jgi:sec-independent protein translocase protein TatA